MRTRSEASGRKALDRRERGMAFLALAIFLLALIVRLLPLQQYHGWDESIYLQHAEHIASGKSNYNELGIRPPLLPLLIAGGFMLWHSPYMASIIVALLGASIVVALFLIGRKLHSSTAGLFAALLAAVHPLFVTYSHLVLTDAIVASLLAFAMLFSLYDRWWMAALAGVFTGLAGLMKFTGFGALVPLLLFISYNAWKGAWKGSWRGTRKDARKDAREDAQESMRNAQESMRNTQESMRKGARTARWRRTTLRVTALAGAYCAGFAAAVVPYLAWAQQRYGSFLVIFERAQAIVNNVAGGPLAYLSPQLFTIPLLAGIALFVWQWKRIREWKALYTILAAMWIIIILGYINTFPNKELRYGLVAIMPLFIIAGAGYATMAQRVRWQYAGAAAAAIILALSIGAFAQLTGPPVNHWKPAAVDMSERIDALDIALNTSMPVYATSDYPVYGYYTDNQVVVVDGPRFLQAYPRIMPRDGYLVIYKASYREPTIAWADSQASLTRVAENDDIALYLYKKQAG